MFSGDFQYWYTVYIIHIHIDKQMQNIFLKDYIRNWHWSLLLRSGIGSWNERKIYFSPCFSKFWILFGHMYSLPIPVVLNQWPQPLESVRNKFSGSTLHPLQLTVWERGLRKPSGWFWCLLKLEHHWPIQRTGKYKDLDRFTYYTIKAGFKLPTLTQTNSSGQFFKMAQLHKHRDANRTWKSYIYL